MLTAWRCDMNLNKTHTFQALYLHVNLSIAQNKLKLQIQPRTSVNNCRMFLIIRGSIIGENFHMQ